MFTTEERERFSNQKELILAALSQGPQTNTALNHLAFRYSARIHELRRAGHRIEIASHDRATGVTVYELR